MQCTEIKFINLRKIESFFLGNLKWLKGRRDVRVFEWKPINIYNSLENVSPKQSQEINHCQKRMKKYIEAFDDIERALQLLGGSTLS